jgi:hypothetical protein
MLASMASGGHADVDALGDSDALAKASRSPKHNTSRTGASIAGSPSLNDPGHSHTYRPSPNGQIASAGGGQTTAQQAASDTNTGGSVTGITVGIGTLALSGTFGPGGTRPDDLTPWLVAGVWAVKI